MHHLEYCEINNKGCEYLGKMDAPHLTILDLSSVYLYSEQN